MKGENMAKIISKKTKRPPTPDPLPIETTLKSRHKAVRVRSIPEAMLNLSGESLLSSRLFQAYFQLGARRTLEALFPLTFDIEGAEDMTFKRLKDLCARYDWDSQVIKWDHELERRLCAKATEEQATAISTARNFLSDEIQKLQSLVALQPNIPFISNMDDFNKAVKLLCELADRLPDGSKKTRLSELESLPGTLSPDAKAITERITKTLTELATGKPVRDLLLELDARARADDATEVENES